MGAKRFRKKPVVIEAMLYPGIWEFGKAQEVFRWLDAHGVKYRKTSGLVIETLEGDMTVSPRDWVIKGVQGEFYPCKPDIFEATYEEIVFYEELDEDLVITPGNDAFGV